MTILVGSLSISDASCFHGFWEVLQGISALGVTRHQRVSDSLRGVVDDLRAGSLFSLACLPTHQTQTVARLHALVPYIHVSERVCNICAYVAIPLTASFAADSP